MRPVAWWALPSAAAAPVLLIGGWTLAATRQPAGYDPIEATISSLAAIGAADRWLMTAALVGVGLCYVVTAAGVRPAARAGRILFAAGGVATVLVAAFPLPRDGSSAAHTAAAAVAFGSLAAWPLLAMRRGVTVPPPLRPAASIAAGLVLLALVAWFVVALGAGGRVGLAERVAAGAQALWPLVVVVTARLAGPGPGPAESGLRSAATREDAA